MDDDYTATIRLQRSKVFTDAVGGTVWNDKVDSVELELVSTMRLEALLLDDPETLARLQALEPKGEGVLAHDRQQDQFEVVPRKDLRAALGAAGHLDKPAIPQRDTHYVARQVADDIDDKTLVSNEVLRRLLDEPGLSPAKAADELRLEDEPGGCGGFDPYNKS